MIFSTMNLVIRSAFGFLVIAIIATVSHAKIGLPANEEINLAVNSGEQHCQKACIQKFTLNATTCLQTPVCVKCWQSCSPLSQLQKTRSNQQQNYRINRPWPLRIATMVKQEFLVLTHLAWEPSTILTNCLVTWEVYGGGLMGNLLTDSSNVELSLWPETRYRVQVTCKNKVTGKMEKSLPIIINTHDAIPMQPEKTPKEKENTTTMSSIGKHQILDVTHTIPVEMFQDIAVKSSQRKYHRSLELSNFYSNMKEIFLGACAALVVFLFILTLFCAYRDRGYAYNKAEYSRKVLVTVES